MVLAHVSIHINMFTEAHMHVCAVSIEAAKPHAQLASLDTHPLCVCVFVQTTLYYSYTRCQAHQLQKPNHMRSLSVCACVQTIRIYCYYIRCQQVHQLQIPNHMPGHMHTQCTKTQVAHADAKSMLDALRKWGEC